MSNFTDDDRIAIGLQNMPVEVILNICHFLDARFVSEVFSKVCNLFNVILNDNYVWKSRMREKWSSKYLVLKDIDIDYKELCVQREEQYFLWSNHQKLMTIYDLPATHGAAIDCFYMIKGHHLITTSRDRSYCIWDLSKLGCEGVLAHHSINAHEGWIWCVDSNSDQFFTGSWDQTIKCWDKGNLNCVRTILPGAAVISLTHKDNLLYAGTLDGVRLKDLREPNSLAVQLARYHRLPVLGISIIQDSYLVSISEDQTLVVRDLRINKNLKRLSFEKYPTTMFYNNDGYIWIGDRGGSLHLLESPNFNIIQTWSGIHHNNVTCVHSIPGRIITSSRDKTICVLQPTKETKVITRIETNEEVSGFTISGNMLISSKTFGNVTVWSPTENA